MQDIAKRTCFYCGCLLSSSKGKSDEHIFKKSWLKKFDHLKLKMSFDYFKANDKVDEKRMLANNVLAGSVCSACNNGWMNQTDEKVEAIFFKAIDDPTVLEDLSEQQEFDFSRYIFKIFLS